MISFKTLFTFLAAYVTFVVISILMNITYWIIQLNSWLEGFQ